MQSNRSCGSVLIHSRLRNLCGLSGLCGELFAARIHRSDAENTGLTPRVNQTRTLPFLQMRIPRLTTAIFLSPCRAIMAAAILHVLLTVSVFSVGRLGLFPSQFNRDGIGEFARDGYRFRDQANSLADALTEGEVGSWIKDNTTFHAKVLSLDFALMRPLFGSNILAAEPVNLFYYLAILALCFSLARVVAGRRAAWLASAIVGLWPSLLLHTTQFMRDPLIILTILALLLVLARLLKKTQTWRSAAICGVMSTPACFLLWMCRREIWPVVGAIIVLGLMLLLIRILRERKLLAWNLAVIGLLCVLTIAVPRIMRSPKPLLPEKVNDFRRNPDPSFLGVLTWTRKEFIRESREKSGSMIDADINFSNRADVIKYIPRALEIGYLSPFPTMWFTAGYNVGMIGRLVGGVETLLTYMIEALACVFVWRRRRHLNTWLMFLTTTIGVLALGIVVVNLGTLYRMRYPFWILMVIMAAGTLTSRRGYLSRKRTASLAPALSEQLQSD